MESSVVVVSIENIFSFLISGSRGTRMSWRRGAKSMECSMLVIFGCLPCKSFSPERSLFSTRARQNKIPRIYSMRDGKQRNLYTLQNWSNFRFTLCVYTRQKKRFFSSKAFREAKSFLAEEICHLGAAHKHQTHSRREASLLFPVPFVWLSHIWHRKKDIYFLLHLPVIFPSPSSRLESFALQ